MAGELEQIGKLAGRWLRAKKTELLTTNRHTAANAEREAELASKEAGDQISSEILMTAFPGLRRMKEQQEARKAAAEADARAELLALPRAEVALRITGEGGGAWSGPLPTRVEIDDDSDDSSDSSDTAGDGGRTGAAGRTAALTVALEIPDDLAPSIGGQPFYGLRFRLPRCAGPGDYDLVAIAREYEAAGAELDYLDYELLLGNRDEGYFWTPEVGPGSVTVGPDATSFTVRMVMSSPGPTVTLDATITLP